MSMAVDNFQVKPTVLVTGAAGKIGRHVTEALLKQGFAVRGLTTKVLSAEHQAVKHLEWRSLDFTRSLDFSSHVADCAAVVHLAAEIVDQTRMQRVNVEATEALAKAAAAANVSVFCYVSSASVYGSSRSQLVTEDSPTVTETVEIKGEHWAPPAVRRYARTKLLGEKKLMGEAQSMRVVIVRPTVVVDIAEVKRLKNWSIVKRVLAGQRHAHHVYVADVADAIVWLVRHSLEHTSNTKIAEIYNIAEDGVSCASYKDIMGRLRIKYANLAVPSVLENLIEYIRFGKLPWRHSFGTMRFSGDRLNNTGFKFPNGLERLYLQIEKDRV